MKRYRPVSLFAAGLAAVAFVGVRPAVADDTIDKALEEQLLEGLDEEVLGDLGDPAGDPPGEPAANEADEDSRPDGNAPGSRLDEELQEELGQDVEGPAEDNPLADIGRRMRRVEHRMAEGDASEPTQKAQEEIVARLDELIKQAKRQKSRQSGGGSKSPGSRRSQVEQAGNQPAGSRTAQRPARDSTARLGRAEGEKVDMEAMNALLKELWGQLPERARERMLQSSDVEFLPKYELMLEEYFRRLAEEEMP